MNFNAHSPSFIDDVAIYFENKTAKQNWKEIEIIVKTAFDWAASNNVKFDYDKSELIHFEKTRNVSKETLELIGDQSSAKSQPPKHRYPIF